MEALEMEGRIPGGSSVGNKSPVINGISRVNPLITGDITCIWEELNLDLILIKLNFQTYS